MRLPRRLQEPKPWEDDAHVHVPIISIKKGHAGRKARQQVEYAGMLVALVAFVSACGVLYEWLRKRRRERHVLPSLVQRAKESAANNPGRAARGEPTLRLGGEAKLKPVPRGTRGEPELRLKKPPPKPAEPRNRGEPALRLKKPPPKSGPRTRGEPMLRMNSTTLFKVHRKKYREEPELRFKPIDEEKAVT